jgi:hypothetical protein
MFDMYGAGSIPTGDHKLCFSLKLSKSAIFSEVFRHGEFEFEGIFRFWPLEVTPTRDITLKA